MFAFVWSATRGYRLCPWKSPYLRWRLETYWGVPAEDLTPKEFRRLAWRLRWELFRFLRWAGRNRS